MNVSLNGRDSPIFPSLVDFHTFYHLFSGLFAFILTTISFIFIVTTLLRKIFYWDSLDPGIATMLILMLIFNSGFCILISIVLDRQGQILSRLKPLKKRVIHKAIYD